MLKSRGRESCVLEPEGAEGVYKRLVGRWIVRLALSADRCLRKLAEDSREAGLVRDYIGLGQYTGQLSRKRAAELLRSRLEKLEAGGEGKAGTTPLMRNLALLAKLVDLNQIEQQVLVFMVWMQASRELREVAGEVLFCNNAQVVGLLATTLEVDQGELKMALDRSGALVDSGLLTIMDGLANLSEKVMLRDGLEDVLLDERATEESLVGSFFDRIGEGDLKAIDFQHLSDELRLIADYLRGAYSERLMGVNVLLYGPPGTGKTEFAKLLARTTGKSLYAVRNADVDGDPASAAQRLSSYRLCQRFLMRSGAGMVLFDEIEDVFPLGAGEERRISKAWMNGTLERNPTPAIWISNAIDHVDRAYLRRFDYSMEFGSVSKAVRERALRKHLGGLVIADDELADLARMHELSPAQVARAGKVARAIRAPQGVAGRVVKRVIERSVQLLGQSAEEYVKHEVGECDLSLINTDTDLLQLVARLEQVHAPVSLCMYGPPGTGKTSFARHLAQVLSKPLHLKRASDVLSPWVGMAEQQISQMFERAEREGAMLFLDEADGLLGDRSNAKHSWEVTQINELLSRMERFRGVFICATNFLDWFDEAAFRRFVLKIKFDDMSKIQKRALLQREYPGLGQDEQMACMAMLESVANLAIGDVAVVRRRAMVLGEQLKPLEFVSLLKAECRFKRHRPARRIGFAA